MIRKSEDISILDGRLQPSQEGDKDFDLQVSYSRLELFENCPLRYDFKYNKGIYGVDTDTIALDMGSLAHKALELKQNMVQNGEDVDYEYLNQVIHDGYIGTNVDDEGVIAGVEQIYQKYGFEAFYQAAEGEMDYEEKVHLFQNSVLKDEMSRDDGWTPIEAEHSFAFKYILPYKNGEKVIRFNGFIDRIDKEPSGAVKVVDYKTSRKVYDASKTTTSLQMLTYALAIYQETGVLPVEYEYSFVFLDERQSANTPGYLKRGVKKIDKLLTQIFDCQADGRWEAKGSPLCYWCEYRSDSIIKDPVVGGLCQRYCEWTPENKVFTKHDDMPWTRHSVGTASSGRKLIF